MPSLFAVLKSHAICGTMYMSSGTKHGTKIFEVSKVQTYCGVSKFHLILGKDEVTSSNLVSSSMKTPDHLIRRFSFTANRDLCREMAIENYFHPLPVDF